MSRPLELPAPRARPRLSWTDAAGSHELELSERRTAGSAVHTELVIADRAVSRIHAELCPEDDGLWVRDLGSRNGTFVGGVKVSEARVPPGASIRFGTTDIAVAYAPPEEPPVLWGDANYRGLLGYSAVMRELFGMTDVIAKTDANVIIEGEVGTGKKALARALHDASPLAGTPLVVVECAALPEPHEAAETLEVALASAEGGTLLLEEPAELPVAIQRELAPPIDAKAFRVIVTTSKDLRRLVNQGAFRESLYFRLAGATLRIPPLREHLLDLPPLLEHFLADQARLLDLHRIADLERLPWLGNIRELRVYADRMRAGDLDRLAAAAALDAAEWDEGRVESDLDVDLAGTQEAPIVDSSPIPGTEQAPESNIPVGIAPWFSIGFKEFRERWIDLGEREYLRRLMLKTNRSSGAASRLAGIERTYLYRLLKKHGV